MLRYLSPSLVGAPSSLPECKYSQMSSLCEELYTEEPCSNCLPHTHAHTQIVIHKQEGKSPTQRQSHAAHSRRTDVVLLSEHGQVDVTSIQSVVHHLGLFWFLG